MGGARENYSEQVERGWRSLAGKFVCDECFEDEGLRQFVLDHASHTNCTYCGRSSEMPMSVPMDIVIEHIATCIQREWTDPAEELPYESAEGGYQGEVLHTYDLLTDEEYITENEQLLEDVMHSIVGEAWCRRNYFSAPESRMLLYEWKDFCHAVKHVTRYMFFSGWDPEAFDDTPSAEILEKIGEIVFRVGLFRQVGRGTLFYRCRVHKRARRLMTAAELGPPPVELAKYSSRMSPAGIPMFYGSLDRETAHVEMIRESADGGRAVTSCAFEAAKDVMLVDLTSLPKVPSLFSESDGDMRGGIGFLHDFVEDLSKPIVKDGREHIEYVPSQIVTEYFRYRLIDKYGNRPDGILYLSSRHQGGVSVVLFVMNEQCLTQGEDPGHRDDIALWLLPNTIERRSLRVRRRPFFATILQRLGFSRHETELQHSD